jgi:tetratricopeptide (TPR) repeat protein
MRARVLGDPALREQAGQFVWLSIDTDKAANAAFLAQFPVDAYPTFLVLEPSGSRAALKWLGSADVPQLLALLADGRRAVQAGNLGQAEGTLARADRLNAEGHAAEAAAAYRQALGEAAPGWPQRARVQTSLVVALDRAGNAAGCAATAIEQAPRMDRDAAFANVVSAGLGCALSASAIEQVTVLEPMVQEAARLPGLLADDRSGLYQALVESRTYRHDPAGAKRWAGEWLTFLEGEAARAPTPEARTVFDSHRMAAALALGAPQRVVAALSASERDLPADYNPPARLCVVLRELGRYDDAIAACRRALARVEGPRRLRVLESLAEVEQKRGDHPRARQTLEEALRYYDGLPDGQRPPPSVRERLVRMVEGARYQGAILAPAPH